MSLRARLLASLYDQLMRGSEELCLAAWRAELLGPLRGHVLDVGAGTGANLPHYGDGLSRLTLLEPDTHMRRQLSAKVASLRLSVAEVSDGSADTLPMSDGALDAVVCTLVLCSVADPTRALSEIHRVLKPGGQLVFIEHVCARDNPQRLRWQRRIEPVWKRLFGGCHLTRDTRSTILEAGFDLQHVEAASIRKAAPVARPSIRGIARKSA